MHRKFCTYKFTGRLGLSHLNVNNPPNSNSKITFQNYGQSFKLPFENVPRNGDEDIVYSFLVVEQCLSFRF